MDQLGTGSGEQECEQTISMNITSLIPFSFSFELLRFVYFLAGSIVTLPKNMSKR